MVKIKLIAIVLLLVTVGVVPVLAGCTGTPPAGNTTPLYIGGSFGTTGPYAEDCAAVLAAFQDYAKWVNANHKMSPWSSDTFPSNITLYVKAMDDGGTNTGWALTNYAALKGQGLLVQRISGSQIAKAMMSTLWADQCGATSQASGSYLLAGNDTIVMNYPIYTDQLASVADYFMAGWNATHDPWVAPNVSYLYNNSFGLTAFPGAGGTNALEAYLNSTGYNISGRHMLTAFDASSLDTGLQLCIDDGANLILGGFLTSQSEPLMVEAKDVKHMGVMNITGSYNTTTYNVTFGLLSPSHLVIFLRDKGATYGNGLIVAGSYPGFSDPSLGVQFCNTLQTLYRPSTLITHVMYQHGVVEAMIQVEAMRLAMINTGKEANQLTMTDVFQQGFEKITNLDTQGLIPGTISYNVTDREGADSVRLDQAQAGNDVLLGNYPLRHLYP
jgi:hypothetical protein